MSNETISCETEEPSAKVVLIVTKNHVKTVKSALESAGQLDRSSKIVPESTDHARRYATIETDSFGQDDAAATLKPPTAKKSSAQNGNAFLRLEYDPVKGGVVQPTEKGAAQLIQEDTTQQQRMCISTTISYPMRIEDASAELVEEAGHEFKSTILRSLNLEHVSSDIAIGRHVTEANFSKPSAIKSPVHKALEKALLALQESMLADMALSPEALVSAFPDGYSIYKPLLLFPHHAFASAPWKMLLSRHAMNSDVLAPVWQRTAAAVGATHVAINSPIPLETKSNSDADAETNPNQENILRRPANLVPIHGDFGPMPTPRTILSATAADFDQAFWVTAKQNGIWQVWAPLYTMFSRGNIREKTRILKLPTVATEFDVPSAAVDLYAGIGYFAFSYKKSREEYKNGIRRVVGWELNPWSVEGLRRGAEKNGWTCKIFKRDDLSRLDRTGTEIQDGAASATHDVTEIQEADFWVFQASNEGAESHYASMCARLGLVGKLPVRHVNLGLLPTSRLSWSVAVGMLDQQRGGWIHVHENIGIHEIESRSKEIERHFAKLVKHDKDRAGKMAVRVDHVEWVKMYAPGVVHCVLDVHVQRAL